ncbi:unnamed protein product [Leptidea sinapis]|uniref:C2 domain-containing protein n=1 Tax=Leptidea sinapis TaxID=189913 RepID=A0A5E4QIP3_9NEOP|nr:unnamed protein product [Leptidea sinapis]
MALLRKIEHCVNGIQPVWEETFRFEEVPRLGKQHPGSAVLSSDSVMLTDMNTQFVEHTIFIMKSILDNKGGGQPEHLSSTSIEGLMLAIVR